MAYYFVTISIFLYSANLQIHRCRRWAEQQAGIFYPKDRKGYMWFLTHEGIDRYNGKEFKQYKLMDGKEEVNSLLNLNWLYIDTEGVLWEIGKKEKYTDTIKPTTPLNWYTNSPLWKTKTCRHLSATVTSTTVIQSGCVVKEYLSV